jgi:general stress protein YciG
LSTTAVRRGKALQNGIYPSGGSIFIAAHHRALLDVISIGTTAIRKTNTTLPSFFTAVSSRRGFMIDHERQERIENASDAEQTKQEPLPVGEEEVLVMEVESPESPESPPIQAVSEQAAPESEHPAERKPASQRGFAAMEREKQRAIASKGGRAAHEKGTAHEFTPDEARMAGKKGGEVVSQNRRHMAEIGRKGGERVSQDREHMAQIGRKGGEAVSSDRAHMAQIGRKGGEARGGEHHR